MHNSQHILIVDYGSQYTQLIARRIRESSVYSKIVHPNKVAAAIAEAKPNAIILSGGPDSVSSDSNIDSAIFDCNVPILGICFGLQLLALHFKATVATSNKHEYGATNIEVATDNLLFSGLDAKQLVWMSHGDSVKQLPAGFEIIANTANCPIAAIANTTSNCYGIQFHPEVTHSENGRQIIANFLFKICKLNKTWTHSNIIDNQTQLIRKQVAGQKVILGLSGGVDSSVTALLLNKAIGKQLYCIFIDNGLLRLNESEKVVASFKKYNLNLKLVDAKQEFMDNLSCVSDPEQKRKVIGKTFIDVFAREAKTLKSVKFLAQGTIYPDVIESSGDGGKAKVIKSHHNVGGLPEKLQFELIEPLRMLFKDEVRKLGLELGLDSNLLNRHPFPGPGLGVRILGEVKLEYANILRQADAIFMQCLEASGYYHKVNQAFTVFLPVKSVGVVGDYRRYEFVIALRAVETIDFMTARWAHLPYALIEQISNRIINEIPQVSRVVYDVSNKPPATIEWE